MKKDKIKLVDNIPNWPGYHVTPTGEVWSRHKMARYHFTLGDTWYKMNSRLTHTRKRKVNRFNESTGRPFVNLSRYQDGKYSKKRIPIHRLVALAYIPNPENKPCVCHKDNNPLNNHVDNLYWGTQAENMSQMRLDKRDYRKVSIRAHRRVIRLKSLGWSSSRIGKRFKVNRTCINRILNKYEALLK